MTVTQLAMEILKTYAMDKSMISQHTSKARSRSVVFYITHGLIDRLWTPILFIMYSMFLV